MFNHFTLVGRVSKLLENNPGYPGIYLELLETKEIIPISFRSEILQMRLKHMYNKDVIAIKGIISIESTNVILIAERVTIIGYAGHID